jgi:polysaccharide biosynthesis/export protein
MFPRLRRTPILFFVCLVGCSDAFAADLPLPCDHATCSRQPYIIEPPDVLNIDPVHLAPRQPYLIEPTDVLILKVAGALPDRPLSGKVVVTADGTVVLGHDHGVVRVSGLTLEEAAGAIRARLCEKLDNPKVSLDLDVFRGYTQTRGDHLVNMDGTITLGSYGSICVTGLTRCQAKAAIERHLSKFLHNPEISLSVSAFNSKYYYVIADGGGYGMQVLRFPITCYETVVDAVSYDHGLAEAAFSAKKIWVSRPKHDKSAGYEILLVDWKAITGGGNPKTNYQLFPGDRVYVSFTPGPDLWDVVGKIVEFIRVQVQAYNQAAETKWLRAFGYQTLTIEKEHLSGNEQSGQDVASTASKPSLPPLIVVNKHQVKVNFKVPHCGSSGLGAADVWLTTDDGKHWDRAEKDVPVIGADDNAAVMGGPLHVSVKVSLPHQEQIYGIYLIVKSGAGLGLDPPTPGQVPQMRVEVDVQPPVADLLAPIPDPTRENGVIFLWRATDRNLEANPITLEYGDTPNGPWKPIGPPALPNTGGAELQYAMGDGPQGSRPTGKFAWTIPSDIANGRAYLRLTVRDVAGNVAVAVTQVPVLFDRTKPSLTEFTISK